MTSPPTQPTFSRLFGALFVFGILGGCTQEADQSAAEGMNLLLITLDTTRGDALTCFGGRPGTTPNIDKLAERSVLFEQAYSATNVTKPSHLSIMTGLRAIEHGVFNNQVLIPEKLEALPLLLQKQGYRTAGFVGAIQLGELTGWRGFDVIEGPPEPKNQRVAEEVAGSALEWLKNRGSRPFFLWTHFFDPHTLYIPPKKFARPYYKDEWRTGDGPLISDNPWFTGWEYKAMELWIEGLTDSRYGTGMYAGELAYTDFELAKILDLLVEEEIDDETVVVLVSDHGEHFGEHGIFYDHAGLYETSLRIPLMMHVPGMAPELQGFRSQEFVTQLDVLPTLSELFGFKLTSRMSGRSLTPILMGESLPDEPNSPLIFEAAHNAQIAIRDGDWKLIWPIHLEHRFLSADPELFNLADDPGELNNLFEQNPEIVARLRPQIAKWIELGMVNSEGMPTMSETTLEGLEDLGYTGGE